MNIQYKTKKTRIKPLNCKLVTKWNAVALRLNSLSHSRSFVWDFFYQKSKSFIDDTISEHSELISPGDDLHLNKLNG